MFTQEEIKSLIYQLKELTGTRPLFYLKFCRERKYAEEVLAGKLYANTPEFFREQEKKSKIRGQGDKNELTLAFVANKLTAYNYETGDLAFTMSTPTIRFKYNDDDKIPVVSFVGIPLRDMKFVDADKKRAQFDFPFSK